MDLPKAIIEKIRAGDFLWTAYERADFREWHDRIYGKFGHSQKCWDEAITHAKQFYMIK